MAKNSINFEGYSQETLRKITAAALLRIKNPQYGIGKELFDAIIKMVPQTAIEAIIVDDIKSPKKVLLTQRSDTYYQGWHFPGSFIRFKEKMQDAVRRVVLSEVGANIQTIKDLNKKYEHFDGRGHSIGLLFLVTLSSQPKAGQWFYTIPKKIIAHHKKIIKDVMGWR